MKRYLALLLICSILLVYGMPCAIAQSTPSDLLPDLEKLLYDTLSAELDGDTYIIEDVNAQYYSIEYLEELVFLSRKNTFFGYLLSDVEQQFPNEKYIFTLGENGSTVVKQFTEYETADHSVMQNLLTSSGILLFRVTIRALLTNGQFNIGQFFFVLGEYAIESIIDKGDIIQTVCSGVLTYHDTGDVQKTMQDVLTNTSENLVQNSTRHLVTAAIPESAEIVDYLDNIQEMVEFVTLFVDTAE